MLKKIRIALASVFFIGLTLLFLDFTGTIHHWLSWMAKVQALEAVLALNVFIVFYHGIQKKERANICQQIHPVSSST